MLINLSPYNHWILYAAMLMLLIFLIMTGVKAASLLNAVKNYKPQFDSIQKNVTLAKIKTDAMQEKKKEDDAKNKKWKVLLPILLAIKHTYDEDASLNGAKGMAKAATKVVHDQNEQRKLFAQFKKQFNQ